ncbi:dihydroxyacetone kinase subunit DhaK [Ensifer sp. 4252]|uniref:dihydroxyacetone kinase subunit DhaK n=1 Tax=Ensifer sp. 4252 TaxID=3373915 RepID=UPI003D260588
MKKFMNGADTFVAESLEGFVRAHDGLVMFGPDRKFVRRKRFKEGKVAVISGGGAGHEPMHVGFVGHGMLDAACAGHVFTSPTPDQISAAIETCDTGVGALLIVKNYDGDVINFEMAAEVAEARGLRVEMVVVNDDVAAETAPRSTGRRGVAGTLVVEKIVGAAAEAGMSLESLKRLGDEIVAFTRSKGLAIGGATVPGETCATFTLGPGEMEVGVGIHGEPGRARSAFRDAETIAKLLAEDVIKDLPSEGCRDVLLFINGFGGTPASELYLMYGALRARVEASNLIVARSLVGSYVTSLDMAGLSVTLTVLDETGHQFWDAPVLTPALRWGF